MEVHAHTHTERKKWTHYFWEFLMLFLAVFCGFLAENQREHYVEHQREKQYMITLLEDLRIDTANMNRLGKTLEEVIAKKDSVIAYLKPPIKENTIIKYLEISSSVLTLRGYTYNGRTVDQLRSSGNYRLIRKQNVTDSLIEYDTRMRGTFTKNYNVVYEGHFKLIELQSDIFDGAYGPEYFDKNNQPIEDSLRKLRVWPLRLLTNDPKILYHYYNACLNQINFNFDLNEWIKRMRIKAVNLMQLIQNEYNLK